MNQITFSDLEYRGRKKATRREKFLKRMNELIPWEEMIALIEPYYPKGKRGRKPRGIETMLRMYLLQLWFSLSAEHIEDAIYDSYAMRNFVGINFVNEQVPDASTLLKFRHLLEKNALCDAIEQEIEKHLRQKRLVLHTGSIVDAAVIRNTSAARKKKAETGGNRNE